MHGGGCGCSDDPCDTCVFEGGTTVKASASACFRRADGRARNSASQPGWEVWNAPRRAFSHTDRVPKTVVDWKVRTRPRRASL